MPRKQHALDDALQHPAPWTMKSLPSSVEQVDSCVRANYLVYMTLDIHVRKMHGCDRPSCQSHWWRMGYDATAKALKLD
jgi:hypothetical protein